MKYIKKQNENITNYVPASILNRYEKIGDIYHHNLKLWSFIDNKISNNVYFFSTESTANMASYKSIPTKYSSINSFLEIEGHFLIYFSKYSFRINDLFGSFEDFILPILDYDSYALFEFGYNKIRFYIINFDKINDVIINQMTERLLDIGLEILNINNNRDQIVGILELKEI